PARLQPASLWAQRAGQRVMCHTAGPGRRAAACLGGRQAPRPQRMKSGPMRADLDPPPKEVLRPACRLERARSPWQSVARPRVAAGWCLLAGLLVAGCSPGERSPTATVSSRLFIRVEIIGSRGTGVGQFTKPRSLALDREDNLYVVDMTGRVQK